MHLFERVMGDLSAGAYLKLMHWLHADNPSLHTTCAHKRVHCILHNNVRVRTTLTSVKSMLCTLSIEHFDCIVILYPKSASELLDQ